MKSLAITVLAPCFAACTALAAAPSFQSTIFESGKDMHIIRNSGDPGERPLHVAPRIDHEFSMGPGPIFDLAELSAECGVDLAPGERVIYSPRSRLVFAQCRPETLELLEVIYSSHSHGPTPYLFELAEVGADGARRSLLSGSTVSGGDFKIAMGETAFALTFVAGPDGDAEIDLKGRIVSSAGPVDITTQVVAHLGDDVPVFESKEPRLKIVIWLNMKAAEEGRKSRALADRVEKELADYDAIGTHAQ